MQVGADLRGSRGADSRAGRKDADDGRSPESDRARRWPRGLQGLPEGPGRVSARYQSGKHSATVGIDYDTKAYNIKMRETSVMRSDGSVHPSYNTWVQNLDRAIRVELASIGQ